MPDQVGHDVEGLSGMTVKNVGHDVEGLSGMTVKNVGHDGKKRQA